VSSAVISLALPRLNEFVRINSRLSEYSRQGPYFHLAMHRHDAPLLPATENHVAPTLPHLSEAQTFEHGYTIASTDSWKLRHA
jgi:hypothetical protein